MGNRLEEYLETHETIRNPIANALGISRATLARLVATGELQRVAQGVYARADSLPDELATIAGRSPRVVFSHETALALHGLHNRIPEMPTITVPTGCPTPRSILHLVKTYRVKPERHDLGRTVVRSFQGQDVPCYDAERTICDIIRSYSRVDIETYTNALRSYARFPSRNIPLLMEYARRLGIEGKVSRTLEVLI